MDAGPPVLKRGVWRQKTDDGGRTVCQELLWEHAELFPFALLSVCGLVSYLAPESGMESSLTHLDQHLQSCRSASILATSQRAVQLSLGLRP